MNPSPFISVIIPTHNDGAKLRKCLEALAMQTYPPSLFEVLVINNGSEENIKKVTDAFPFVHYLFESKIGSYAARHAGIQKAKGSLLAFTDSDCIPNEKWLENGSKAYCSLPTPGVVAGNVVFSFKKSIPTTLELFDSRIYLQQKNNVEKKHVAATANLFIGKEVYETSGGFDTALRSSGDFDLTERIYNRGYPLLYSEDAFITHPARSTMKELLRKQRRVTGGVVQRKMKKRDYSVVKRVVEIITAALILPSWLYKIKFFKGLPLLTQVQFFGIHLLLQSAVVYEQLCLFFGKQTRRS